MWETVWSCLYFCVDRMVKYAEWIFACDIFILTNMKIKLIFREPKDATYLPNVDLLQKKVQTLEDENLQLKLEVGI